MTSFYVKLILKSKINLPHAERYTLYLDLKDQSVNAVLYKNLTESTVYLTLKLAVRLLTTGF